MVVDFEKGTLSISVNGGKSHEAFGNGVSPPVGTVSKPLTYIDMPGQVRLLRFSERKPMLINSHDIVVRIAF